MQNYQLITNAAEHLRASEKTLLEFGRAGWIAVIPRNGCLFLSCQDEYRARFILHLRQNLRLTDEQITFVLANEEPPYSVEQVPGILNRHGAKR
jgi:hypothetical protein